MPNPWSVVRYNKTVIAFNGLFTSIEGNNCLLLHKTHN